MSMSKKNTIIKYQQKDRDEPYELVQFNVPRLNGAVPPVYVKIPKSVHQFDGDKAQVNCFVRDTLKEFRVLIQEYIWTPEEQFTAMRNQILIGKAKDH